MRTSSVAAGVVAIRENGDGEKVKPMICSVDSRVLARIQEIRTSRRVDKSRA